MNVTDSLAIIIPFLTSLTLTAILTFFTIKIALYFGLVDDPGKHKHPGIIHSRIIPRAGGLPLFFGTFITSLLFIKFTSALTAVFFASSIALVTGLIDDKLNADAKDLSPYFRFFIILIISIIVVVNGISINYITNPFAGGVIHLNTIHLSIPFFPYVLYLSNIITVIWLIWVMNMTNWSKGVDGQMPGIVAISAITIGLLSLKLNQGAATPLIDAKLSFIIAGAAIGFLLFNFYPAKIFPGWSATSLYVLLGVVAILSSAKLATAILVMAVPMVDALFIIIRRIRNKKSPFQGDKNHLHHILLKLGYNQRQVAFFYWGFSTVLGLLSLVLESKSKLFAMIMVIAITAGGLLFLHTFTKEK